VQGREFLLELPIRDDFALIHAQAGWQIIGLADHDDGRGSPGTRRTDHACGITALLLGEGGTVIRPSFDESKEEALRAALASATPSS
jgi:hypothetical protein